MRIINGKLYDVCRGCGKIVRLNKPLVGSFHVCNSPEEQMLYAAQIAKEAERNARALMEAKEK